jgi:hypothetical protein
VLLSALALATALAPVQVPAGDILVADLGGRARIVDSRGQLVHRLRSALPRQLEEMELAPDRRHAFISLFRNDLPAELFQVDLSTGRKRKLGDGISPTLSPDKTRLAYISMEVLTETKYLTSLMIRTIRTGATRRLPLAPKIPLGTPPELVINWSPDGQAIALFDGTRIRIVDAANGADVPPRRAFPPHSSAPVFIDRNTLVMLSGCCMGPQGLVAVDLRNGARTRFATLSSPVEQARRIRTGVLLVRTALHELMVVSRGHVRVIARRVEAAAP